MNNHTVTQEDLVLLVCGELDQPRRTEVEDALRRDDELARQVADLQAALAAAKSMESASTSSPGNEMASLKNQLRTAWESELADKQSTGVPGNPPSPSGASGPLSPRRHWWPAVSIPLTAAAAVILMVMLWSGRGGGPLPPGNPVWADVVKAMDRVKHFQVTVYEERGNQRRRIQAWYAGPNTWRVQTDEMIAFISPAGSGVYDVKQNKWSQRSDKLEMDLLPGKGITAAIEQGRWLDAMLAFLFEGQPPQAEPVKSDQASGGGGAGEAGGAGDGLAAFDYANNPKERWARIWVLKESKLPIRVNVYEPGNNSSSLIVFDYTTETPPTFFDLAGFDKAIKDGRLTDPQAIFGVSLRPIDGKPTNGLQIYDLQGGYKPPKLVKIEANKYGDLFVTAENPQNKNPRGGNVAGEYFPQIYDNWGNTYYSNEQFRFFGREPMQQTYILVPPFKTGTGKHTVTLRYTVWDVDPFVGQVNHDKVISEETVAVPAATIDNLPKGWNGLPVAAGADLGDEGVRAAALFHFYLWRTPLREMLRPYDRTLAKDPRNTDALLQKIEILRQFDLDDDRFVLFEEKLRDKAIASAFTDWQSGSLLGDYMLWIWNAGREADYTAIRKQLEPAERAMLADTKQKTFPSYRDQYKRYVVHLATAMAIPRVIELIDNGEKPAVEKIARGRDGYVFVQVIRPPNRNKNSSDSSWGSPMPQLRGYRAVKTGVTEKAQAWLLEPIPGEAPRIAFRFDVMAQTILPDADPALYLGRVRWMLGVKLPEPGPAGKDDLLKEFPGWAGEAIAGTQPGQPGNPGNPGDPGAEGRLALTKAYELKAGKQYAPAIAAYQRVLAMPEKDLRAVFGGIPETFFFGRRSVQIGLAQCYLALDQMDPVQKTIDALAAETPAVNLDDPEAITHGADLRGLWVDVVTHLIEQKKLGEARKLLENIERGRPDWRMLDSRTLATKNKYGISGWVPARSNYHMWRGVDLTWWKLRQAETGQRIPPAE